MSKEMTEKVCKIYTQTISDPNMTIEVNQLQNNRVDGTFQKFGLLLLKNSIMRPSIVSVLLAGLKCSWQRPDDLNTIGKVVNRSSMAKLGFICNGGSIEGDYTNIWTVVLIAPSIEQILYDLYKYMANPNSPPVIELNTNSQLPELLEKNDVLLYKNSIKIPLNNKFSIILPIDQWETFKSQVKYHRVLVKQATTQILIELNANFVIAEFMILRTVGMMGPIYKSAKKFDRQIEHLKSAFVNFRGERGFGSTDKK